MMDWPSLLSASRFQQPSRPDIEQRSVFQRDYDRIVFCSAFRRLQDKTQVHPFATSDYVRRRLTHSLEVSSVGRSLGFWLGTRLATSESELSRKNPFLAYDVAQIVSNACLAHDIGNPPFGHAGEEAIGGWFKAHAGQPILSDLDDHDRADFERFEGNAQGFRLLTRLQNSTDDGGLRLTFATLGAFTKYPSIAPHAASDDKYIGSKKHGFFKEDVSNFEEIANTLGLIRHSLTSWSRHPLVFLVEAADDICYKVVDIEDGFKLGRLTFREAEECLVGMLSPDRKYKPDVDANSNIGWLRAAAIGSLIDAAQAAFIENEAAIMQGIFSHSLLDASSMSEALKQAKHLLIDRVFEWDRTITAEISGSEMITYVLNRCMHAVHDPAPKINSLIIKLIPGYASQASPLRKIHAVTDFVSGMTDSYLRTMYLRLSGHAVF
jgi:dGTPase